MKFDPLTLIIISGLANIYQASAIFFHYNNNRKQKGVSFLTYGFTSVALGFVLLLAREVIASNFISIILGNSLLLLGAVFIYIGIVRFLDFRENLVIILPLLVFFLLTFVYFTYITDDMNARNIINSAYFAYFSLMASYALFTKRNKLIISSSNFLGIIFLIHGVFFIVRGIYLAVFLPLNDLLSSSPIQIATYMVQFSVGILMTFGLISLVNQKLNNETKEAKEHFELIFNTGPDASMITRLQDGVFLDVNHGFEKLSGFTKEEVIGRSSLDVNVWKKAPERQGVVELLLKQGFCDNYETTFLRKDGSELYGLLSAKIIMLEGVSAVISVIRDISEKKQYEKSLHAMNELLEERVKTRTEELQKSNQELEEFAYSISHDLRTPLRAIQGFSQMLGEEFHSLLGPEGIRKIDIIRTNTNKMNQLILDLLAMANVTRYKITLEKLQMRDILEKEITEQTKDIDPSRIEIILGEIPDVQGDGFLIRLLWNNLIENAITFSRSKQKSVIKIHGVPIDNQIVYSIQDNGIGFNPSYSNKIFKPFHTLQIPDKFENTGIGLAIVERIAQRHGGKVWAEGEEGVGATFYFSLPVEDV
jgi:PAS domain S-box-containing protein